MTTLIELAERCEVAAGSDRELDAAIAVVALGFLVSKPRYEGAPVAYAYIDKDGSRVEPGNGGKQLIRNFTASIDAAMTLVPEGWYYPDLCHSFKGPWTSNCYDYERAVNHRGEAATPALALCAAALKARAAQGIEAATAAETVELGSVHESPVGGNADAPKGESRG